jgi:DNA-directed RNA polymerase specialized sigma24 family protein
VSTPFQPSTRAPYTSHRPLLRRCPPAPVEEVALVAHAARRRLLRAHGGWLRFEDLEDCYSQAVLELLAQARRGQLRCASRRDVHGMLALRFASRVRDRRRALNGRSPREALLDSALVHGGGCDGPAAEVADPRADVERRMLLRFELRSVQLAAHRLSPDQRLVLACQVGAQMGAAELCATFGWSREKHRKLAQRARAQLRRGVDELAGRGDVLA